MEYALIALAFLIGAGAAWYLKKPEVRVQTRTVEVPVKLPENLVPAQGPVADPSDDKEMGWESNDKFSVCPTCGSRLKVKGNGK
jgi:hypothetical protein